MKPPELSKARVSSGIDIPVISCKTGIMCILLLPPYTLYRFMVMLYR